MPEIILTGWVISGVRVAIAPHLGGPLSLQIGSLLLLEDQGSERKNLALARRLGSPQSA